jgi:hypothetical protein
MDVEKTIEFLLEQQAAHAARFDAESAEFRAMLKESSDKHDREMAGIRAQIRRGVRMAVEEQRRERVGRQKLEAQSGAATALLEAAMVELAAAQADTQKTLQQVLQSLNQPRNGHDKA